MRTEYTLELGYLMIEPYVLCPEAKIGPPKTPIPPTGKYEGGHRSCTSEGLPHGHSYFTKVSNRQTVRYTKVAGFFSINYFYRQISFISSLYCVEKLTHTVEIALILSSLNLKCVRLHESDAWNKLLAMPVQFRFKC